MLKQGTSCRWKLNFIFFWLKKCKCSFICLSDERDSLRSDLGPLGPYFIVQTEAKILRLEHVRFEFKRSSSSEL